EKREEGEIIWDCRGPIMHITSLIYTIFFPGTGAIYAVAAIYTERIVKKKEGIHKLLRIGLNLLHGRLEWMTKTLDKGLKAKLGHFILSQDIIEYFINFNIAIHIIKRGTKGSRRLLKCHKFHFRHNWQKANSQTLMFKKQYAKHK
ncbi:hypothetical protein ACJX0J_037086, partial [Zea mays]